MMVTGRGKTDGRGGDLEVVNPARLGQTAWDVNKADDLMEKLCQRSKYEALCCIMLPV